MSNRPTQFRFATPADDAALQDLLRRNPMRGAINLSLERTPSYFRAAAIQGDSHQTVVAVDPDGKILCAGEVSYRLRWLGGRPQQVGYLGALRLDASARGKGRLIRKGYAFFQKAVSSSAAALHFTSIAADNVRARRFLERGLRGMPRYDPIATYTTYTLRAAASRTPLRPGSTLRPATPADAGEMIDLLTASQARRALSPVYSVEAFEAPGLALGDTLLLRRRGRLVAMAALWDQRPFKQAVIRGYAPWLAIARPLWNLAAPIGRWPVLPATNHALRHAIVSHLAVADDNADDNITDVASLLAALRDHARRRQLDGISIGFDDRDPLACAVNRRLGVHRYRSRLYRVEFARTAGAASGAVELDNLPVSPELALL